jgi:hypothetical protein
VHAQQPEITELGGDLPWEVGIFVPTRDIGADARVDERANPVPLGKFVSGEQRIQVQVVPGPFADRGGRGGDGPGVA